MWKKMYLGFMCILWAVLAHGAPIKIVAAENFYGELASEIGGKNVIVQSIINNPDADPHLFTTSPSISKSLANAQIIIYNGANYDPWMEQMLKSIDTKKVAIINVASLMNIKPRSNPHIWYLATTFPTLAKQLASQIISLDPTIKPEIEQNLSKFIEQYKQVTLRVNSIKAKYNGIPVTATEPVFGYMANEMGLVMQGLDFQWKIMNDTEPSPQMLASFEGLLTGHKVKILFYNQQVIEPATQNILKLAQSNKIPVVGVTETMPQKMIITEWLLNEINKTEKALQASK